VLDIGQYIQQLLITYPEVGVPGMGIFKKERTAARYDEEQQQFVPPMVSYSLLAHAGTDHRLIQFLVDHHHLSESDAQYQLEQAVADLLAQVDEQGTVKLDGLGFLKQVEGKYTLVPFTSSKSYWGWQPIEELKEEPAAEEITETPISEESNQEMEIVPEMVPVAEEEQQGPILAEQVAEAPLSEPDQKSSRTWLWVALGGLVLIGLVFFFRMQPGKQSSLVEADSLKRAQPEAPASSEGTPALSPIDSTKTASDSATTTSEPLVRKPSELIHYTIVLGSFTKLAPAMKQAEFYRTKGIAAFVLESNMPQNRKKICLGNYPTRAEAKVDLTRIRAEISADAFIFPQE